MSRITDIAIGIVLGAGGIIGAAFAWDKYENSDTANDSINTEGESDAIYPIGTLEDHGSSTLPKNDLNLQED